MKFFFLFLCYILFSLSVFSQKASDYTIKSKKAIKLYESAQDYYNAKKDKTAKNILLSAIKEENKFIEAIILVADIYSDIKQFDSAVYYYQKAISINPSFYFYSYLNLGLNQLYACQFNDAINSINTFLNNKGLSKELINKALIYIQLAKNGMQLLSNPVEFNPVSLGDSINTKYPEYSPTLTADEQTIIFTVRLPKTDVSVNFNNEQEDFYISHKINDKWTKAVPLGYPINSMGNEGAQCISPDGSFFIFTACNRDDGMGSCDLYISRKNGNKWTNPENLGTPVNSSYWESQPSISSDGKTLFFASNRFGGKGYMDIWKSELQSDGTWGNPENMGDSINTSKGEFSPFIHPDNKTLYFASNGHPALGGFDIFISRKDSNNVWSAPKNLGYPINTCKDEMSFIVNANGDKAYFATDNFKSSGDMDLYSFNLYEKARPTMVTYMKGIVFDKETNSKLKAHFELIDLKTGKTTIESYSDNINGDFLVCIPANNNYALNVSKDGYLFYSENFSISEQNSSVTPFLKNIPLQPINVGEKVVLKNIFFETAKYDLKQESKIELEKLIVFLNKNSTLKIEIGGHTDNVGNKDYNQKLSENRAKAVYQYLISRNISKDRLFYKGYGDLKPIDSNDSDSGKANNRRTEFIVMFK